MFPPHLVDEALAHLPVLLGFCCAFSAVMATSWAIAQRPYTRQDH